jgi:hypothetical protein
LKSFIKTLGCAVSAIAPGRPASTLSNHSYHNFVADYLRISSTRLFGRGELFLNAQRCMVEETRKDKKE